MTRTTPSISVVLVVGDQREYGFLALHSLLHQNIIDQMQVLVVDCSLPSIPAIEGTDHPSVEVIRLEPDVTFGEARAEGVRRALAPVVGFLEELSVALAGWAEATVRAHEGPWAAVGGEVYLGNAGVGFADSVYVMNYAQWLPPASRGEAAQIPSNDSSFKRDVLMAYDDDLDMLLLAEPMLLRRLSEDGHKFFVEPDARYAHSYVSSLRTLAAYFAWSRNFGVLRGQASSWPAWKRLGYMSLVPLLPWFRIAGLMAYLVRSRPERLWSFVVNVPAMILAQYAAALGQGVGLMFGRGQSVIRYSQAHFRGF